MPFESTMICWPILPFAATPSTAAPDAAADDDVGAEDDEAGDELAVDVEVDDVLVDEPPHAASAPTVATTATETRSQVFTVHLPFVLMEPTCRSPEEIAHPVTIGIDADRTAPPRICSHSLSRAGALWRDVDRGEIGPLDDPAELLLREELQRVENRSSSLPRQGEPR